MQDVENATNAKYGKPKVQKHALDLYKNRCPSRFESTHKPYTSKLAFETEHIVKIHQWR